MTAPRAIAKALLPGARKRPRDPETGQLLAGVRVQARLTGNRGALGYFTSWAEAAAYVATLDQQREVKSLLMIPLNAAAVHAEATGTEAA